MEKTGPATLLGAEDTLDSALLKVYSEAYPDVALSGLDPEKHYFRIGRHLGRSLEDGVIKSCSLTPTGEPQHTNAHANVPNARDVQVAATREALVQQNADISNTARLKSTYLSMGCSAALNTDASHARPIAIISTYNDVDIIAFIVGHAMKEFDVYLIDNWSTDGTWDIIKSFTDSRILGVEQFPSIGPTDDYEWQQILMRKEEVALRYPGKWILHQDSDEVTISPFTHVSCAAAFCTIENHGYNMASCRMLDFRPVDDTFVAGDPVAHFKYFEFSSIPSYQLQNKIWLQPRGERVNLAHQGGHNVTFDSVRPFPFRFPRLHYSVRSSRHLRLKAANRAQRSAKEQSALNWHTHLESLQSHDTVRRPDSLIKYCSSTFYDQYFTMFCA